jgi:phosphatidylserine decarboxylase
MAGMTPTPRAVRREQTRQARRIHGGLVGWAVALLGIKLARLPLPTRALRRKVFRTVFGTKYPPGLNEAEADRPLGNYPTLNALFTRGLKPECRPVADGPHYVSPCDGRVQDLGRVEKGKILTLKGIEYTLESLLPGADVQSLEGGRFAVIFLSPIDCHRVFSPLDGRLEAVTHVPGSRLLVHPPYQTAEFPVYTLNERVVFRFATDHGPAYLVMVAGWGVGHVTLPLAPDFRPRKSELATKEWSPARPVRRGEWVGTFELGSTVVLITPPAADATPLIAPEDKLLYGQAVFLHRS